MKRDLREFVRDLLGRSHEAIVDRLERQVALCDDAVAALRTACEGREVQSSVRLGELEHEGDALNRDLTRFLASSLSTPIDREDLFRLSRSIDDVLDNLRDFSRELELYRPPDVRSFLPLLRVIGSALDALHESVRSLAAGPDAIVDAARRSDHAASAVRHEFELAIARVLDRASDDGALRERELLRRLDVVGLRLGEAADALGDGGLKRIS